MLDGLPLEPHTVLGVARDATFEQVRDAYHRQSKKYHPDRGGDEWAFRIVVRAYQILSATAPRSPVPLPAGEAADTGRIRPGVHDKGLDPLRVVHVEILWMRYPVDDVLDLFSERPDDRNLSGSMQVTWPDPALADQAAGWPHADQVLRALNAAFDEARARGDVRGARSQIDGGRFEAQLGYPNGHAAWQAFKNFHFALKARGLGVKQWTRDLTVPRP